ncbi:tannase/feruloyl esterase family alpha/beta hydrolase [Hydrogenophaga sp.]|uniref:tannase/feruloyl esterase family alpha/beta hydrolase n=1 Tax=Hydrogenophaga sp. TaxID=1904254 RepID=UPI00261CA541|nr:tannase/feruloyl esterase family alpha/beta hydrolase [Hydrogenophaga sp.]MDM7949809.1 tannase/feruloyl esterase family alpha/beta hydrolase [Hydrogenophaga sp.]
MRQNRHPVHPLGAATAMAAAIGLSACAPMSQTSGTPLHAAKGAALQQCETLVAGFRHDQTALASSAAQATGALKMAGRDVPEHCLVKGSMHARKGSDGRDYAIGFEMRLPKDWNGRFYYQGNGGLDGNVRPAEGALGGGPLTGALMQGFAVISSDAGHTGAQTPYFGSEAQSRLDYGYQAVAKLTPMAKALIATAYGKGPDRSYIGGCSNGGRHAMVEAARGQAYDGYLVGAPGYRLPNAALAQLWGAQQWAPLAAPGATTQHPMVPTARIPDLSGAFTRTERQLVADAIVARCDAIDGARDGMVQATQACQSTFKLATDVPSCTGERNGQCLSSAQKAVIAKVFAGGRTDDGQSIYSAFAYDPGLAADNWATWKFTNSVALDPLAVGSVFSVPPGRVDPLTVDINARLPLFSATSEMYRESGMSLMTPPGHENPVNHARLLERGAKMVLYHGVADAIFSAEDTRQWMLRLDKALGGQADRMARYFPVPGMAHCSGGPSTDQFDLLTPLVRWVEHGQAPQAVPARAHGVGHPGGVNAELPAGWAPSRSRPLCAYPSVATYKGSGSLEDAASFSCR